MQKHIAILGSLCAGVMIAGASIGAAEARTIAGFSTVHIEILNGSQNLGQSRNSDCLTEWYGAVVNNCSGPVNLVWDLAVDSAEPHPITVQDYWQPWPAGTQPFSCTAYVYDGVTPVAQLRTNTVTFTGPGQAQYTTAPYIDTVYNGTDSVQLICWGVPVGAGISNITWSP